MVFGTRHRKKQKKKKTKKRASKLKGCGGLKGFLTSIRVKGCMSRLYLACNIQAFHATVTIRCRELE